MVFGAKIMSKEIVFFLLVKHWPTEKCLRLEGQVLAEVKSNLVKNRNQN